MPQELPMKVAVANKINLHIELTVDLDVGRMKTVLEKEQIIASIKKRQSH